MNSNMTIITINVNRLNSRIKRQRLSDKIGNEIVICFLTETQTQDKITQKV